MTNDPTARVPAGVPTGGQFAASAKSESGIGLAEHATFFPPAPMTAHDAEVLAEYKGTFEDGYDGDKVNRVFMRLDSAHLMCVWDRHDDYGYGGGSEFYGVAVEGYEASKGHFTTRPVGSYRALHPDVWEFLNDPDSDIDPERIPSLLADEVFEGGDPKRDMSDLPGDGFRNVSLASYGEADHGYTDDEADEDAEFTGSGWGPHRPTEVVTDFAQIRVGDVLAEQDEQFGARNLFRVTSIDSDRGVLHGFFVDPHIPEAKRLGSDMDQARWDFQIAQGEMSFTDIRGPE